MRPFGVILLGAGSSSRLGFPKQLIPFRGKPLIRHLAEEAIASGATEVVVVLGASADQIAETLDNLPLRIARNDDWESGMASSVRAGVSRLSEKVECVVIMVADQPAISATHILQLAQTDAPIVASEYGGILGVPAAFARGMFPNLLALHGDEGARSLIRKNTPTSIPFESATLDIDSASDIALLGKLA